MPSKDYHCYSSLVLNLEKFSQHEHPVLHFVLVGLYQYFEMKICFIYIMLDYTAGGMNRLIWLLPVKIERNSQIIHYLLFYDTITMEEY